MKKIIVYDFDKTLTYKDTLFEFFRFASNRSFVYPFKLLIYIICIFLAKFHILSNTHLKRTGVWLFLKGIKKNALNKKMKVYNSRIRFNNVFEELKFNNINEYYVVSASFKDYLRPIFYDSVHVIGSTLLYDGDKVKDLEFNCYKDKKVKELNKIGVKRIDEFYTDSYNDLPLAEISEKVFIVDRDSLIECNSLDDFIKCFRR